MRSMRKEQERVEIPDHKTDTRGKKRKGKEEKNKEWQTNRGE